MGALNRARIPHPAWFSIASMVVYLPAARLGARAVRRSDGRTRD